MKLIIPFICSLLLIGCSNDTTAQAPSSSENNTSSVETNQTVAMEANMSTEAATPPAATASTDTKPLEADAAPLFAQKCASCHGAKAEKAALNKSQIIANFSEAQIKEALKGYQNGTYGKEMKAVMQGQAKGLNDAQIDALASYVSGL